MSLSVKVFTLFIFIFVFVFVSSHSHGHSHSHSHDEKLTGHPEKIGNPHAWFHAILATLVISFMPILILPFVPISDDESNQSFLKILVSFALGGLLGDVFLHLLPHEFSNESSSSELGLWVLGGMLAFFLLEKYMRSLSGETEHSHSHSHEQNNKEEIVPPENVSPKLQSRKKKKTKEAEPQTTSTAPKKKINVSGYLNLIADASHNFTDGMAIGTSFLVSYSLGISTTIAVFFS